MKIAIIGYGKMGKAIEEIALTRGHRIVLKITSANLHEMTEANLKQADVAIEFTNPENAFQNVVRCLKANIPVVCGSTGWNDRLHAAQEIAAGQKTAFLQSSNFSIGVNIFFEINKRLAALMETQEDYDMFIEETHHLQKKDAPSGTAITLAAQLLERISRKKAWEETDKAVDADVLKIQAFREENIPGTHLVKYTSAIDDIEIKHTAHNRKGFAKGAVLAAEYIAGKEGIYTMQDVLGIR